MDSLWFPRAYSVGGHWEVHSIPKRCRPTDPAWVRGPPLVQTAWVGAAPGTCRLLPWITPMDHCRSGGKRMFLVRRLWQDNPVFFFYNLLKVYCEGNLTDVDADAFNLSYFNVALFKSIWNFRWMNEPHISTQKTIYNLDYGESYTFYIEGGHSSKKWILL